MWIVLFLTLGIIDPYLEVTEDKKIFQTVTYGYDAAGNFCFVPVYWYRKGTRMYEHEHRWNAWRDLEDVK